MLHIYRAERADGLVEALRALLASPLPDPFASEVVVVPTRGMERWLAQRMSDRLGAEDGQGDGVCANVDFPSPRRFVGDAVATASGIEADEDPWLPERAVWALLEVVDGCLGEPWWRAWRRIWAVVGDGGGSGAAGSSVQRGPAPRGAVRSVRAASAGDGARLGARGEDGGLRRTGYGRPSLWRRLRRPNRRCRIRPSGSRACLRAVAGRARDRRSAGAALALRADAAAGGHLNVLRALGVGGRCMCSCCIRRRRCGSGWRSGVSRSCGGGRIRPRRCGESAARVLGAGLA